METAIDLFAGGGGFTEGAEQAGLKVLWAANHWKEAVEIHALNHPEVWHECQDLHQANWSQVPSHDILLASPACQGHSKARGKDKAHHDESRSTAWAVVSALEFHQSEFAVIENVYEFSEWKLFPIWKEALHKLGYSISMNYTDSADYGVPQQRPRLFMVASRSKNPIEIKNPKMPHVGIGDFIDWDYPKWSKIDKPGRSKATLARAERGRKECGDRFVMPYYGNGSGLTGRDLNRPLGTVTTRDRWAVVDGDRMRMLQVPEYKAAMGFPDDYQLPTTRVTAIHLLGNAVCPPVAANIISQLH